MDNNEVTLQSLAAIVAQQGKQLETVTAENAKLKGSLLENKSEAKLPEIPKEPISVGGKKYLLTVAHFTLPGDLPSKYTAEEAATDEDVLEQILTIKGQGILKEIV